MWKLWFLTMVGEAQISNRNVKNVVWFFLNNNNFYLLGQFFWKYKSWPTCRCVAISILLKSINECTEASILSSKTEGGGRITSAMYCTRYVWWILFIISEFVIGMISLKFALSFKNNLCRCGAGLPGSYSRQPTTSKTKSSANIISSNEGLFIKNNDLKISYKWWSPSKFSKSSQMWNKSSSFLM